MKPTEAAMNTTTPAQNTPPTLWQMIASVAWSFFGVQNSAVRHRDFKHGNAWHFIVVGVLMTAAVVLMFYGLVKLVLHNAGV
jgi:hypothetical protein